MDWQGILFLVAGIGGLQVVLERGQDEGWFESGWIAFLSVVAAVSVVAFIWREWTAPHPVVHLRLLRVRSYGVGVFFSFIQGLGLYASMFLVPVFTQGILGMTAMDTGLLLLPSSILTALSMPVIGKIMQRGVSARLLAGLGFLLFFVFTVMLGRLNGQVGANDFFWPLVVRGIGMGMLFIPLTTLALGQLSGREIPQGTAMTNMVRQLGGSVGIALVASFVDRRMTFHRSVLAEHVVSTSPATWARLQAAGAMFMSHGDTRWEAQRKALGMVTGAVAREAAVMSYLDAFRVVGFFFVVSVPFVLLFKKPSSKIDPASMSME
jgi:DHA2 family multidrug resistance protein